MSTELCILLMMGLNEFDLLRIYRRYTIYQCDYSTVAFHLLNEEAGGAISYTTQVSLYFSFPSIFLFYAIY